MKSVTYRFAEHLMRARRDRRMASNELAWAAGVSPAAILRIEIGKTWAIQLKTAARLCSALDAPFLIGKLEGEAVEAGGGVEELRAAIRETRVKKGWTQEMLVRRACVSRNAVYEFETGKQKGIFIQKAHRLCAELGIRFEIGG